MTKPANLAFTRQMMISDYDEVCVLEDRYFPFRFELDKQIIATDGFELPSRSDLFKAVLQDRSAANFVALDSAGAIIGYANGRPHIGGTQISQDTFMLNQVAVGDNFRGAGIARSLVERVVEHAAAAGFYTIFSSIPETLRSWYKSGLKWEVLPTGSSYWWVDRASLTESQPALTGDYPGPVEHGYTSLALKSLGTESQYLSFAVSAGRDVNTRLVDLVASEPSLIKKLPTNIGQPVLEAVMRRKMNPGKSFFRS